MTNNLKKRPKLQVNSQSSRKVLKLEADDDMDNFKDSFRYDEYDDVDHDKRITKKNQAKKVKDQAQIGQKYCQNIQNAWDDEQKQASQVKQNNSQQSCQQDYFYKFSYIFSKKQNCISNFPQQNKIRKIILNLPKLQQYLASADKDKIKIFVQQVFNKKIKDFLQLQLGLVYFQYSKVVLRVKIKCGYQKFFMQNAQQRLNQYFNDCINISELVNKDDMSQELKKKYLLVKSVYNDEIYSLIAQTANVAEMTKQVMNLIYIKNNQLKQSFVSFKKVRLHQLKKYIQYIQTDQSWKNVVSNIRFQYQLQNTLRIIGTKQNINLVQKGIAGYLSGLDTTMDVKSFFINDLQALIVEKNMIKFSQLILDKFNISFKINRNIKRAATLILRNNLESHLTIMFERHNNIFRLPYQTVICFDSRDSLDYFNGTIQEVRNYILENKHNFITFQDKKQEYFYLYCEKLTINQIVKQLMQKYPYKNYSNQKRFAFVMPKQQKSEFIHQIIRSFNEVLQNYLDSQIKIFIFQQTTEDIKKTLTPVVEVYNQIPSKYQYYVVENKKELYYTKVGNQKINKAVQMGKDTIYLTNQDLNLQVRTHEFLLTQNKMIDLISKNITYVHIEDGKMYYRVKNIKFQIPKQQVNKLLKKIKNKQTLYLSIGAQEINLANMTQINLFSGFIRKIQKNLIVQERKDPGQFEVNFNQYNNQIQIHYGFEDVDQAYGQLKKLIQAEKINTTYKLQKNIQDNIFQTIKQRAKQLNVELVWYGEKELKLSGCDKITISTLTHLIMEKQKRHINYLATGLSQNLKIHTFIVSPNSKQFKQVQQKFTIGQIKELFRIQNCQVYKQYMLQKQQLTKFNGGKIVKQMMLFHGTRNIQPKLIYQGKCSCFNINQTSNNNCLGRGTYFAQKSQYCHPYAYRSSKQDNQNLLVGFGCEMFCCCASVGDPGYVAETVGNLQSMREKSYKNEKQRIRYESATTFTHYSNIYEVYKNRRAYPQYLIRY